MVADKVHRHANRAQGSARWAILKHHATDWRILIDVFKRLQSDPLVGWSLCSLLFCYMLFSLTIVWVGLIKASLYVLQFCISSACLVFFGLVVGVRLDNFLVKALYEAVRACVRVNTERPQFSSAQRKTLVKNRDRLPCVYKLV